jgi:hypothetical protein
MSGMCCVILKCVHVLERITFISCYIKEIKWALLKTFPVHGQNLQVDQVTVCDFLMKGNSPISQNLAL